MKVYTRLAEAVAAILLLLAPAMWNGFPFLQYDSGGYLARWFEGYLVPSRSTVYGLFAVAGWPLHFWPEVFVQAAVAVWVIWLMLRVYGFADRPLALLGTVAALAAVTSLPWLAGILLTDIFAGTSVLALHLLLYASGSLSRRETVGLVLLVSFSAATHSATLAVLMAIVAAAGLARLYWRNLLPLAALGRGAGALVLGAVMLVGTNFALSGQVAWTPGGYGIVFARMLEDGIVARYLEEHCPQAQFKLCPYRHRLPRTADEFLWNDGPFSELGRFTGLGEEMRTIVLGSLAEYPVQQIETAAVAAAKQIVKVENGEGVLTTIWHTYGIIQPLHAEHRAGDARGPPAARRGELPCPQRGRGAGRADLHHAAPVHCDPGARGVLGPAPACGDRERGRARQCRRMRGPVEPARPLRRADRLDRDLCRRARSHALCGPAALEGDDRRGVMPPLSARGVRPVGGTLPRIVLLRLCRSDWAAVIGEYVGRA